VVNVEKIIGWKKLKLFDKQTKVLAMQKLVLF
jgi:hypothetical protein